MRNDDRHAAEIAEVALDVLEWTRTKNLFSGQRQSLEVRIGIHTGKRNDNLCGWGSRRKM